MTLRGVLPPGFASLVSKYGKRRIGTRVLHHRFGTFNDAALNTWHVAAEMATHFDAVRLVLANTDTTSARYYSCAVSVMASAADLNNSSGTWTQVGQGIDSTVTVPNAPKSSGGSRVSYGFSNWIQLASVARGDGGAYPLIAFRARNLEGNAALPVYGNGSDDLTNWASRATGRLWCARVQNVDGITTPSNFTSTTNVSQSAIVGIQYVARGKVITVMGCSDSIGNGRGTYIGEGYGMPACDAIQAATGIPIEYADCSWPGQNSGTSSGTGYMFRALDIMRSELKPDIMFTAEGSPNDISQTLSSVVITGTAGQFSCTAATLYVNQQIVISGTFGGTGSITGYANPTTYFVIATNGSTTFTLSATLGGAAITTTAGTPTGLTYSTATITQALIDRMRYQRDVVVQEAAKQGVGLVLADILPSNNSVKTYGSTDSFRTTYNTELATSFVGIRGVEAIALATLINGSTHATGQIEMNASYTSDGIHPNDAGNAVLAVPARVGITNLLLGI